MALIITLACIASAALGFIIAAMLAASGPTRDEYELLRLYSRDLEAARRQAIDELNEMKAERSARETQPAPVHAAGIDQQVATAGHAPAALVRADVSSSFRKCSACGGPMVASLFERMCCTNIRCSEYYVHYTNPAK